jgi:hypothetical protein
MSPERRYRPRDFTAPPSTVVADPRDTGRIAAWIGYLPGLVRGGERHLAEWCR